jgi:hypothetical protein
MITAAYQAWLARKVGYTMRLSNQARSSVPCHSRASIENVGNGVGITTAISGDYRISH